MRIETPRGVLIQEGNQKARLEWNTDFQPKWEERYSTAQKFVDSEVIRLCAPYTPFSSSFLQKSALLGTDIGSGTVEWIAPYARYLYYGTLMVSPSTGSAWAKKGERKILTDTPLNYNQAGSQKRGKLWFERMKGDHKEQIISEARRIAGGGM